MRATLSLESVNAVVRDGYDRRHAAVQRLCLRGFASSIAPEMIIILGASPRVVLLQTLLIA